MTKKQFSYEKSIERVEEIIDRLRNDEQSTVDNMLSDVEEAAALLRQCREHLHVAEEKLGKILSSDD